MLSRAAAAAAAALLTTAARSTTTPRRLPTPTSLASSSFSFSTASFTKKRANELRPGTVVALDPSGTSLAVIEKYSYTQGSGRQLGIVQATLRRVGAGAGAGTTQARWRPGDDVTVARLQEREATLLYREGGDGGGGAGGGVDASFALMDRESLEMLSIPSTLLDPVAAALLPDGSGLVLTLDAAGTPIAASPLDTTVEVAVAEAPPPKTGAAPGNKSVVLEGGASVRVPNHVKAGDRLVVDTRDGSFVRRAG